MKDRPLIYQLVSKLCPRLPVEVRTDFLTGNKLFTAKSTAYLASKHGVNITTASSLGAARAFDRVIAAGVRGYNHKTLNIVLDNIVASMNPALTAHQANIAYIGCAFILVLCHNMHTLKLIDNCQVINLHDGYFQYLDGYYVRDFLILFAKSLKRLSGVLNVNIYPQIQIDLLLQTPYLPSRFNRLYNTDIQLNALTDIQNIVRPYISMNGKNYLIQRNSAQPVFNSSLQLEPFKFPHSKRDFTQLVVANKSASRDMWYLNFMRDCMKAEIALDTGAIYITHDRLAHLYYRLMGGTNGFLIKAADKQGTDATEQMKYDVSI